MNSRPTPSVRALAGLVAVSTGLTAGMFTYGALNVAPAFHSVPLDVRFTFHAALMSNNAVFMQAAMGLSILSSLVLALMLRGPARLLAAGASALGVATFLITRLGNVPINRMIQQWVTDGPPADYAAILSQWEIFHDARTGTAIGMFVLALAASALAIRHFPSSRHRS